MLPESVIGAFWYWCHYFSFKECRDLSSARSFVPFQRIKPPHPKTFFIQCLWILGTDNIYLWIEIQLPAWNYSEKPVEQLFKRKKPHFLIKSCCYAPLQILEPALGSSCWNSRIYEKKPVPHTNTFFSLETTVMLLNWILSHFWKVIKQFKKVKDFPPSFIFYRLGYFSQPLHHMEYELDCYFGSLVVSQHSVFKETLDYRKISIWNTKCILKYWLTCLCFTFWMEDKPLVLQCVTLYVSIYFSLYTNCTFMIQLWRT